MSHLSGAGTGWPISKSKGTECYQDFVLLSHNFFFFFFHFLGRGGTETIASNVKSLLILPTNSFLVSFVSFACTVLFDHLLFIIIMIIVSIRICYISMLHRYNKARLFLYLPLPPPSPTFFLLYIYLYILSIEKVLIYSTSGK